jgi:hypothetical protein
MKTPLYRQALAHSWNLAWKHKWLWPVGLFAALLGQMGVVEYFSVVSSVSQNIRPYQFINSLWRILGDMEISGFIFLPYKSIFGIFIILMLFSAIAFIIIYIAVVSQGTLIHASAKSVNKKSLPEVEASWHAGAGHFWRLLALNILKKVVIFLLGACLVWCTYNAIVHNSFLNIMCFLLVFVFACLAGLFISFYVIYAAGYVVVEEYSLWNSLKSAWRLFIGHWLVSLEVGFILMFLNLLLGLVVLFAIFLIFIPNIVLWIISGLIGSSLLFAFSAIVSFFVFLIFLLFIGSLFTIYTTSVWTYLFMEMHKKGVASRVFHWFKKT